MKLRPLTVPILIDSNYTGSPDQPLPIQPTLLASWTTPASSSVAGPSRCIALACPDNTIWISTWPETKKGSSSRSQLPKISLPPSSNSSAHQQDGTPLSPLRRPASAQRNASYAGRARDAGSLGVSTPRNRAASSASSVASSSKRRVSAFSPPTPAPPQPVSSLSAATASFAPPTGQDHSSRSSLSERDELLEHLREQRGQDRRSEEGPSALGLGIAGLGRRGLPNVHGKEENLESSKGHVSGSMSPRSVRSDDSSHTLGNRLISRLRGEDVSERDRERAIRERIEEVEVDREMEREVRDQQKEKEDMRKVAAGEEIAAARRTPGSGTLGGSTPVEEEANGYFPEVSPKPVTRVFLRRRSRGKIISICAVQELGILCVLRDNGLLDSISLSSLSLTSSIDLDAPDARKPTDATASTALRLAPFWKWRNIRTCRVSGVPILIADGLPWPCGLPSPNGEVTRVIMLRADPQGELQISTTLELPGEGHVGIVSSNDAAHLVHFTSTIATSYPIRLGSPIKSTQPGTGTPHRSPSLRASSTVASPQTSSSARIGGDAAHPSANSSLRPPESGLRQNMSFNSMKEAFNEGVKRDSSLARFLAGKKGDADAKLGDADAESGEGVSLGGGKELERDGYRDWTVVKLGPGGLGAGVADGSMDIMRVDAQKLRILTTVANDDPKAGQIQDAFILPGDRLLACSEDGSQLIALPGRTTKADILASLPGARDISTSADDSKVLLLSKGSVQVIDVSSGWPERSMRVQVRFEPINRDPSRSDIAVPFGNGFVFSADRRGTVTRSKLGAYLRGEVVTPNDCPEGDRLESPVTCMRVVRANIGPSYLAAGDADGCVRIWDADTFALQGSWTLFAWPVSGMALLDMPEAGPLINCLICVSQAGTVGMISLTEMDQLFIIPAARSPLRRVFICEKDIMLAYANGKARVWNTKTMEFRRSTGLDAAEDMLQTGKWTEVAFDRADSQPSILHSQPGYYGSGTDSGQIAQLDVRQVGAWLHTSALQDGSSPLELLRNLLSVCLTFGLDDEIDAACTEHLGIARPKSAAFSGWQQNASQSFSFATGVQAWQISPEMTGLRQLVIVALLRPFLDSPDMERWAAQVIAFYTASLPASIVEPELDFFANFYLDPGTDVHQAARMLFSARLNRMTDQEIDEVVIAHQDDLPTTGVAKAQDGDAAVLALTLIGGMALHKYQSINPSALKAVAESILSYLHRPDCPHTGLAIELTSKGFATWQTYVDASDLLRRLFYLATHNSPAATAPSKGAIPDAQAGGPQPQTIPAQARLAVLHIASAHPALFMSTLSMDILDAKSLEGRKSIMKLCVFLTRKKPQVLEHSLPKIAEAVVKSLDPNVGKMREEVWEAATVILNELVLAFSTIDFHSGTQRLAVGTHEGALIMYDLKSASRLYVIEPHRHPVSSVCFSPDGRRLITVSLEEGSVTVWKVGSSLSGFFNVGGPPRQGNEKGEPFKRIVFMRADDRPMESTTALSDIKIEWPGARQARVMIKETALTFET